MNYLRITERPDKLSGKVLLPSSKSISNRALIIRQLCGQHFNIHNLSIAEDTLLLDDILAAGDNELYIRNAGTAMRFLTAYFAGQDKETVLRGTDRMHERPLKELVEALRQLGADIKYLGEEGFAPLLIKGKKLKGGYLKISADVSSQFVSALLLIAPTLEDGLDLELKGEIVSGPYIHLTLNLMSYFGIEYQREERRIKIPRQKYVPRELFVESDWSAASYFYALASLFPGSSLQMPHLFEKSMQGDSNVREWMKAFGVQTEFSHAGCSIISDNTKPSYFEEDLLACPDLIPTFSSLCCTAQIPFYISGTRTLQYKESKRDEVLVNELSKLGHPVRRFNNSLTLERYEREMVPESDLHLLSHEDHRMAMSWALPASQSSFILIDEPEVTGKSFPGFWQQLEHCGFRLEHAKLKVH